VLALMVDWNWDLAEREFLAALERNSAYIQARCWYALIYLQLVRARHADAIAQARRAVEQDPLSAYPHAILGEVLWQAGDDREAVAQLHRAAELDPASFFALWNLGMCHHHAGRFAEAEDAYRRALAISGRHPWVLSHLGIMMADSGRAAEAEAVHAELEARAEVEYVQPSIRAILAAALGASDHAIALAHQACDERDAFMSFEAVCAPMSRALRSHPRFGEILDRMHLR
jgi:Flp pilus assembly protein TadD